MGRCHEFGLQISEGCSHEMLAGENQCTCAACGIACGGQFAGCPDVWARGQPVEVHTPFGTAGPVNLDRVTAGAPSNGPATMSAGEPSPAANGIAASWEPEPPLPPLPPLESLVTVTPETAPAPAEEATFTGQAPVAESEPAPARLESGHSSSQALADVSAELRSVTDGLKMQQSMLGDLLSGLTRQQAMMAELLDARHAELRLAMVAESLPDSVADAVSKAFAANQEELTAASVQLAKSIGMDAAVTKALRQVANRTDDKFEELCVRLEKLVAKAMRAGARQTKTEPTPAKSRAATTKKAQPAKKTSRTSAQGTRPSRRSLGS
jgi:hypothetical protein